MANSARSRSRLRSFPASTSLSARILRHCPQYPERPQCPVARASPPLQPPGTSCLQRHARHDAEGAPDPTQIAFAVNVRPTIAATEPDVAPGNRAVAKTIGPYQRYTVQFGINAHDISCPPNPDGTFNCNLNARSSSTTPMAPSSIQCAAAFARPFPPAPTHLFCRTASTSVRMSAFPSKANIFSASASTTTPPTKLAQWNCP